MVGVLMQQLGAGSRSRTQIAAARISRMLKVAVVAEIDTSWEEGTGGFSTCNMAAVAKNAKQNRRRVSSILSSSSGSSGQVDQPRSRESKHRFARGLCASWCAGVNVRCSGVRSAVMQ